MLALVLLRSSSESPLLLWNLVEFPQDVVPVNSMFSFSSVCSSVCLLFLLIQLYNVICENKRNKVLYLWFILKQTLKDQSFILKCIDMNDILDNICICYLFELNRERLW